MKLAMWAALAAIYLNVAGKHGDVMMFNASCGIAIISLVVVIVEEWRTPK